MPMFFERNFDHVKKKKKKYDETDFVEITPQETEPETQYGKDELEILPEVNHGNK
jgi:hypothetical protein